MQQRVSSCTAQPTSPTWRPDQGLTSQAIQLPHPAVLVLLRNDLQRKRTGGKALVAQGQWLAHLLVSSSARLMEILGRERAWVKLNNLAQPWGQQVAGPMAPAPNN